VLASPAVRRAVWRQLDGRGAVLGRRRYEWELDLRPPGGYRDYLSAPSINQACRTTRFIREHVPALAPNPPPNAERTARTSRSPATAYLSASGKLTRLFTEIGLVSRLPIDAFSKSFQADYLPCARCHDHSWTDLAEDYYGLSSASLLYTRSWSTPSISDASTHHRRRASTLKGQIRGRAGRRLGQEAAQRPALRAAEAARDQNRTPPTRRGLDPRRVTCGPRSV